MFPSAQTDFVLLPAAAQAEATDVINKCLSGLYREGLFIRLERAEPIALQGLQFLRLYSQLALLVYQRGQKRFPLAPKGHYLHHQFLTLLQQARSCQWGLNPLCFAVQQQEDFIGKPSRLCRRVSAKTASLRVIQRTFLAVRNALGAGDPDVSDLEGFG